MSQKKAKLYQHVRPLHPDEQLLPGHVVQPHHNDRKACAICLLPIKVVPDNEGPDSLKAFFRF